MTAPPDRGGFASDISRLVYVALNLHAGVLAQHIRNELLHSLGVPAVDGYQWRAGCTVVSHEVDQSLQLIVLGIRQVEVL